MIKETLDELQVGIGKAHDSLTRELAKIRTGRASASLLDSVVADYYGVPTPINQMASITVPEARMLVVKPFEKQVLGAIERAIMDAHLNVNPQNDGQVIRIPMPALTEERRKDLVKVAKGKGEDSKVSIRKARHEAIDMIDALQKDKEIGEDDADRGKKKVEELVKAAQQKVDEIVAKKEKDILEV